MTAQIDTEVRQEARLPAALGDEGGPSISNSLLKHVYAHVSRRKELPPLLPAEFASIHAVTLPSATRRQRAQLLTYAVEDKLAAPVDQVIVMELPRSGREGAALAVAVDRSMVEKLTAGHLPEVLALACPAGIGDWHVWRDGDRVLVRAGDGTGFAARNDALASLWHRAGKPALISVNEDLDELPFVKASKPRPDSDEIAFRIYPPAADPVRDALQPLRAAASVTCTVLVLHLALAAADAAVLAQRAEVARADAQTALSRIVPNMTVTPDTGPLLARLAPRAAQLAGSDAVPMLTEVAAALLSTGAGITMRRMTWGAGRLQTIVLAPRLEDLQIVEEALRSAGFAVRAGAASAGQGGAEAEMTIERVAL